MFLNNKLSIFHYSWKIHMILLMKLINIFKANKDKSLLIQIFKILKVINRLICLTNKIKKIWMLFFNQRMILLNLQKYMLKDKVIKKINVKVFLISFQFLNTLFKILIRKRNNVDFTNLILNVFFVILHFNWEMIWSGSSAITISIKSVLINGLKNRLILINATMNVQSAISPKSNPKITKCPTKSLRFPQLIKKKNQLKIPRNRKMQIW